MSEQSLMESILDMQTLEEEHNFTIEPHAYAISPASVAFCFTPFPFSSISAAFCNN